MAINGKHVTKDMSEKRVTNPQKSNASDSNRANTVNGNRINPDAAHADELWAIIENSVDAHYKYNLESGTYDYMSPVIKSIIGLSAQEYIEGGIELAISLLHPDDKVHLDEHIKHLLEHKLEKGLMLTIEYRMKHVEHGYRWIRDKRSVIYDENENPKAIIGTVTDITEKKSTDEELRQYEKIVSSSSDLLSFVDSNYIYLAVNDAYSAAFGKSKEEIVGRTVVELFGEEQFENVIRPRTERCLVGEIVKFEDWYQYKDGKKLMSVTYSPYRNEGDEVTGIVVNARDITIRHEAIAALKLSEERYELAVKGSNDGIWDWDIVTDEVYFSQRFIELLGYSSENDFPHVFESFASRLHPDDYDRAMETIRAHLDSREPYHLELRLSTRDGSYKWFLTRGQAVWDEEGSPLRMAGSVTDITLRLATEENLLKSQKLESLGVLAGGLAHDFNNSLMGIGLLAGAARLKSKDRGVDENLIKIEESVQQASGITQQLLTFAKGGSPILQPGDCRPIIKAGAEFALHGTSVALKLDFEADLQWVVMDSNQINQVIGNLCINAAQAMPNGGTAVIRLRNKIFEGSDQHPSGIGQFVEISVSDEGIGIAPDAIDSIFDPYFTTKMRGNGLGLASCYSIIEKHGGWITAVSELGHGSTFSFYLPTTERVNNPGLESADAVRNIGGHILIMDDDDKVRTGLASMLNAFGSTVVKTASVEEAESEFANRIAEDHPFDAVILDLTIPGGVGGVEALRRLRLQDEHVKAIVCSGYADDPVMSNYEEFGFQAVLAKPFRMEDLRSALTDVLQT